MNGMRAQDERSALTDVRIVRMRHRHLRRVMEIEESVYPRPWGHDLFASEIQRRDRRYFVALARRASRWPGRQVVGYAGLLLQADEAHVATLAVHPAQHRRKVASRLLVSLLWAAVGLGAVSATLEVRTSNLGARRLYQAFGFAPVGVRPGYYAETGEDALIMWVHGLQGPEFAERLEEQRRRLHEPGGSSGTPDLHVPWVTGRVGLPGLQQGRGAG